MTFLLIAMIVTIKAMATSATPIQNGVIGYPQVTCNQHSITVEAQTERPFSGRLFVKGEAHLPECSRTFNQGSYTQLPPIVPAEPYGSIPPSIPPYYLPNPQQQQGYGKRSARSYGRDPPAYERQFDRVAFEIGFDQCHVRRQRTLTPRGVDYSFTLVVSFHPSFITKIDKAYRVKCFYMEADKVANSALDVSMIPTTLIEQQYPMPQCQYHVRTGGPEGPDAKFARVGEMIYHVWTCDKAAGWVYGMLVKNCYVDDGQGNKFLLINDKGCAIDQHLVGDLTYDNLNIAAFVESHVFKYADKPTLYFSCTIELCLKGDGGCIGKTPPQCFAPPYPQEATNVAYPPAPAVAPPAFGAAPSPLPHPQYNYVPPLPPVYSNNQQTQNAQQPPNPYFAQPPPTSYPYRGDVPLSDEINAHSNPNQTSLNQTHSRRKRSSDEITGVQIVNRTESTQKMSLRYEADFMANPVVVLPFEEQSELYNNQDFLSSLNDSMIWSGHFAVVGGGRNSLSSSFCVSAAGFGLILALFLVVFLFSVLLTIIMVRRLILTKRLTKN